MRPLDIAVFGPLKTYFEQELNFFRKKYAGTIANRYDICKIFTPAYLKAGTIQNAIKRFDKPSIWPFKPTVFTTDDFMPATVTSRPDENAQSAPNIDGPNPQATSDVVAKKVVPVSVESIPTAIA